MTARSENNFPTICDVRNALTALVERGLGDLAVQIIVAPDSTMQAIARDVSGAGYDGTRPALMIDLTRGDGGRMPVAIISTDRLQGDGPTTVTQ